MLALNSILKFIQIVNYQSFKLSIAKIGLLGFSILKQKAVKPLLYHLWQLQKSAASCFKMSEEGLFCSYKLSSKEIKGQALIS